MENLWPSSLIEVDSNEASPKTMLEEQIKFLKNVTKDVVYAEIAELSDFPIEDELFQYDFVYGFYIKGKYLEKYSYRAFVLYHQISLFPVFFQFDTDINRELGIKKNSYKVNSPKELQDFLRKVFSSNKIKQVVSSIIRLSK